MYSKIPMPDSEWTEENMSHAMCFFPFVGLVIGAVSLGIFRLWTMSRAAGLGFSPLLFVILLTVTPIFISGGIHLDGFLDTMDALSSWQTKERRLEILKDPHAGAFAIISGGVYLLLSVAGYSSFGEKSMVLVALGFILSRTLSGISVVTFPQARKKGLVATFAEKAAKKQVRNTLFVYLTVLLCAMVFAGGICGMITFASAVFTFFYYRHMSMEKFGGVTGDLAGYFLQVCELVILWVAVLSEHLIPLLY